MEEQKAPKISGMRKWEEIAAPAPHLTGAEITARENDRLFAEMQKNFIGPWRQTQNTFLEKSDEADERNNVCLRELLHLSVEEIVSWFDIVIRKQQTNLPDGLPDVPLLKAKIAELRPRIVGLKEEFDSMSAKKRRDLDDQDEVEHKRRGVTRQLFKERFKREWVRCEKEIANLQNEMRRTTPVPLPPAEDVIDLITRKRDFLFRDYPEPACVIHYEDSNTKYHWADLYKGVLALQAPVNFSGDYKIENDVISRAIMTFIGLNRLCPLPPDKILHRYPWITQTAPLSRYALKLDDDGIYERLNAEDGEKENALIIKTGGAQIGGQIQGAGWRRQLSSFNLRPERFAGSSTLTPEENSYRESEDLASEDFDPN